MTSRALRCLLILPFFAGLLYLVLGPLSGTSATVELLFGVFLFANLLYLVPRRGLPLLGGFLVLVGLVAFLGGLALLDPTNFALFAGAETVLLAFWFAIPFFAAGFLALSDAPPAMLVVVFEAVITDAIVLVASFGALSSSGSGYSPGNVLGAAGNEVSLQFRAWAGIVLNRAVPEVPLQAALDPLLVAFAALALLGVIAPVLELPSLPRHEPLASLPSDAGSLSSAVSPEVEGLLARGSRPVASPPSRLVGVGGLMVAGIAVGLSLEVALYAPTWLVLWIVVLGVGAVGSAWLVAGRVSSVARTRSSQEEDLLATSSDSTSTAESSSPRSGSARTF